MANPPTTPHSAAAARAAVQLGVDAEAAEAAARAYEQAVTQALSDGASLTVGSALHAELTAYRGSALNGSAGSGAGGGAGMAALTASGSAALLAGGGGVALRHASLSAVLEGVVVAARRKTAAFAAELRRLRADLAVARAEAAEAREEEARMRREAEQADARADALGDRLARAGRAARDGEAAASEAAARAEAAEAKAASEAARCRRLGDARDAAAAAAEASASDAARWQKDAAEARRALEALQAELDEARSNAESLGAGAESARGEAAALARECAAARRDLRQAESARARADEAAETAMAAAAEAGKEAERRVNGATRDAERRVSDAEEQARLAREAGEARAAAAAEAEARADRQMRDAEALGAAAREAEARAAAATAEAQRLIGEAEAARAEAAEATAEAAGEHEVALQREEEAHAAVAEAERRSREAEGAVAAAEAERAAAAEERRVSLAAAKAQSLWRMELGRRLAARAAEAAEAEARAEAAREAAEEAAASAARAAAAAEAARGAAEARRGAVEEAEAALQASRRAMAARESELRRREEAVLAREGEAAERERASAEAEAGAEAAVERSRRERRAVEASRAALHEAREALGARERALRAAESLFRERSSEVSLAAVAVGMDEAVLRRRAARVAPALRSADEAAAEAERSIEAVHEWERGVARREALARRREAAAAEGAARAEAAVAEARTLVRRLGAAAEVDGSAARVRRLLGGLDDALESLRVAGGPLAESDADRRELSAKRFPATPSTVPAGSPADAAEPDAASGHAPGTAEAADRLHDPSADRSLAEALLSRWRTQGRAGTSPTTLAGGAPSDSALEAPVGSRQPHGRFAAGTRASGDSQPQPKGRATTRRSPLSRSAAVGRARGRVLPSSTPGSISSARPPPRTASVAVHGAATPPPRSEDAPLPPGASLAELGGDLPAGRVPQIGGTNLLGRGRSGAHDSDAKEGAHAGAGGRRLHASGNRGPKGAGAGHERDLVEGGERGLVEGGKDKASLVEAGTASRAVEQSRLAVSDAANAGVAVAAAVDEEERSLSRSGYFGMFRLARERAEAEARARQRRGVTHASSELQSPPPTRSSAAVAPAGVAGSASPAFNRPSASLGLSAGSRGSADEMTSDTMQPDADVGAVVLSSRGRGSSTPNQPPRVAAIDRRLPPTSAVETSLSQRPFRSPSSSSSVAAVSVRLATADHRSSVGRASSGDLPSPAFVLAAAESPPRHRPADASSVPGGDCDGHSWVSSLSPAQARPAFLNRAPPPVPIVPSLPTRPPYASSFASITPSLEELAIPGATGSTPGRQTGEAAGGIMSGTPSASRLPEFLHTGGRSTPSPEASAGFQAGVTPPRASGMPVQHTDSQRLGRDFGAPSCGDKTSSPPSPPAARAAAVASPAASAQSWASQPDDPEPARLDWEPIPAQDAVALDAAMPLASRAVSLGSRLDAAFPPEHEQERTAHTGARDSPGADTAPSPAALLAQLDDLMQSPAQAALSRIERLARG